MSASLPTPALVRSVAEAAHYSSVRSPSQSKRTRASLGHGLSDDALSEDRKRVLHDLKEVRPSGCDRGVFGG